MNNVDPCSEKYFVGKVFGISSLCCERAGVIRSDSAAHWHGYKALVSEHACGPGGECVVGVRRCLFAVNRVDMLKSLANTVGN